MNTENQVQAIQGMIEELLADQPSYFLVEIKIKPTHNVKVYLDGDQGITIEKCISINRALYKLIEAAAFYPEGEFSLEVSSPGLDEPLKLHRQYEKNVNRMVEVLLTDGQKIEGKLMAVSPTNIEVEETRGKNKKKEVLLHNLSLDNIKSTKLQVVF